jgi:hypothetical protein
MAPIQLLDNEQQSGCLSNILSRFTSSSQPSSSSSSNEKFIYSAVDPMEDLPPYQDIVKVNIFPRGEILDTDSILLL